MNPPAPTLTNAEAFRQVLKLMTAHASDYRPQTYAVWYEYVLGRNPALTERLRHHVDRGERVPPGVCDDLYQSGLSQSRERLLSITHAHLQALLDGMAAAASDASAQTEVLTRSLDAFDPMAFERESRQFMEQSIALLAESTRDSRNELVRVQDRLRESEEAIQRMSEELAAVREEAHIDPLTGLANRRRFDRILAETATEAASNGSPLTLLMIDIDRFKLLNDNHGHHFGDQVIQGLAQAIKSSVKGRDLPARLGGDEFAVLLPDTPADGGETVANFIRRIVERARMVDFATNEMVTGITLSVGVATLQPSEGTDAFSRRADAALYEAKRLGRNRVARAD